MADTQKKSKRSFFKGIKSEFKKITWPTKDDVLKQTLVVTVITVVVVSVICCALIALLDYAFGFGMNFITSVF